MCCNSLKCLWKCTLICVCASLIITLPVMAGRAGSQSVLPPSQTDNPPMQVFSRQDADAVITIQDAIRAAIDESFDFYQLKEQYLQISYGLEAAKRRLRTRVYLNNTIPNIAQEDKASLGTNRSGNPELFYATQSVSYLYTALKVEQPLSTNGKITLGTRVLGYDQVLEQFTGSPAEIRSIQPRLWLEYTQPLFQYNTIKGQLRTAELEHESLDLSYTEAEIRRINRITRQFYELFSRQRNLEVADHIYQQSDINYQIARARFESGLISELDQLSLEVTRSNSYDRLESARNELEKQQNNFNRLVGIPLFERVWAEVVTEYRPILVDMDRALQLAQNNRSNVRQVEIDMERSDLELRQIAANGKPDLQLNIAYDLTGNSARSAMSAADSWSDHFGEAFAGENWNPNTNVSLTLRVPIFDWGLNASNVNRKLSSIRVQQRELEEVRKDLQRDVENRVSTTLSSMRRLERQVRNLPTAETNYQISQTRFERGEVSSTELLMAQQLFIDTQMLFTSAFIEFETAKADLREITMWDWENNRPVSRRTTPPQPFAEGSDKF